MEELKELEVNETIDYTDVAMNANDGVNSELVKEALERDTVPQVYTGL